MRKPKIKTYKNFQTCSKAAKRLNGLALLHGFNKYYLFLCYTHNELINGKSVTTWFVASKDYIRKTDDLLYVVNGKSGLIPFRVLRKDACKF